MTKKKIVKRCKPVKEKKRISKNKSHKGIAQWWMEFEKLALRKPLEFSFMRPRGGISVDPFLGVGNEETLCAHDNPITCPHVAIRDASNDEPHKIIKSAATRGELGAAPSHYSQGKYTPWEVIDDWKLGYYDGNAMKYVCRHKHKGKPVEDIQKAIDCLIKYRDNLKKELGQ